LRARRARIPVQYAPPTYRATGNASLLAAPAAAAKAPRYAHNRFRLPSLPNVRAGHRPNKPSSTIIAVDYNWSITRLRYNMFAAHIPRELLSLEVDNEN
jgi:hypothetical protein